MSDNTKLPAYPLPIAKNNNDTLTTTQDVSPTDTGFTKLELASLMIAAAIAPHWEERTGLDRSVSIAQASKRIAKAVLEEANK